MRDLPSPDLLLLWPHRLDRGGRNREPGVFCLLCGQEGLPHFMLEVLLLSQGAGRELGREREGSWQRAGRKLAGSWQ